MSKPTLHEEYIRSMKRAKLDRRKKYEGQIAEHVTKGIEAIKSNMDNDALEDSFTLELKIDPAIISEMVARDMHSYLENEAKWPKDKIKKVSWDQNLVIITLDI